MSIFPPNRRIDAEISVPPIPRLTVGVPVPPPAVLMRRQPSGNLVDRILAKVVELTTATVGALAWRGQILKGRFFPSTASFSVGEVVLAKRIGHSTEWAVSRRVGEMIYYGIPQESGPDATQAELWKFDGTTHTKVYTTTFGYTYGNAWITSVCYLPTTGLIYFTVYYEDYDIYLQEYVSLYSYSPSSGIVALLTSAFDAESGANWRTCAPIYDEAWFQGKLYLGQGSNGYTLSPRIYSFDVTTNVLTMVYAHPTYESGEDSRPSLAVYGNDARLFFCAYYNVTATGDIYSTTDGTTWALFQTINVNAELTAMMTDRKTGKVYLSVGWRPAYTNRAIWVCPDGIAFVLDLALPIIPGNFGAQFLGTTRQNLWAQNWAGSSVANNDARYGEQGAWNEDDIVPDFSGYGEAQTLASQGGQMLLIASAPGQDIVLRRRQGANDWPVLAILVNNAVVNWTYRCEFCICRAGTAVLPHEQ